MAHPMASPAARESVGWSSPGLYLPVSTPCPRGDQTIWEMPLPAQKGISSASGARQIMLYCGCEETHFFAPGTSIPDDHDLVTSIIEAHTNQLGKAPQMGVETWYSDAAHMNRYGIPTVNYGSAGRIRTGGGGGWMPGTYDAQTNTIWWGTGNPAPLYDWAGLHRFALVMGPAGFVAVTAGWVTTEVGRQPYTVYGLLRTAESASPLDAPAIAAEQGPPNGGHGGGFVAQINE